MALPNLIDWAKTRDPDGTSAIIAEMLSQCNEVLSDMLHREANGPTYHKASMRIGLPIATWRLLNQGVAPTSSKFAQTQFGIGQLSAYSQVDKTIADLEGDTERYRMIEDMGHLEGMSQQMASTLFYGNSAVNPQQFTGLGAIYSTVSTATAQIANYVIDMGGTGSSNSSIYLVGWNENAITGIFPKGSPAGLQFKDWGDIRAIQDANNNPYEGYTSVYTWNTGLAVMDYRYGVRMANISTTALASATPPDLFAGMAFALTKPPKMSKRTSGIVMTDAPQDPVMGNNWAFYCNRTVRHWLDIQAVRQPNVLLSKEDYDGQPIVEFRGIPVRVVDALSNSEAQVV